MSEKIRGDGGQESPVLLNENMIIKSTIERIVEEGLQGSHLFATEIIIKPNNKILIYIDGDQYVTVDDCIFLSRKIESKLDRDEEDFELQVSSAGADKAMKLPRQFPKNIGKRLEVMLTNGEKITGTLLQATQTTILVAPEVAKGRKLQTTPTVELNFADIEKATRIISFK